MDPVSIINIQKKNQSPSLVENFKYITYFVIVLEYPEIIEKVCRLTESNKKKVITH